MRITKKARLIMLVAMAFVAIFAFTALAGCNKDVVGGYYLSVYGNGSWSTYTSVDDIPSTHKFVEDSANENVYKLTIDLEEGAKVQIAQVGSDVIYGGNELFGAGQLTKGANDEIVVVESGKFELTLDVAEKEISFKFTAKQTGGNTCDNPECECETCTGDNCTCGDQAPEALTVTISGASSPRNLAYNDQPQQLTATVMFDDGTSTTEGIEWISSTPTVATVTNGLLTPITAGTTQITAKYGEVTSTALTVNVNGTATLVQNSITLDVNANGQIEVNLAGGATIYQWRSSDREEEVIKLGENGAIEAVAAGTATVTIDWYVRPGVLGTSLQCTITVNTPVEDMTVPSALTVAVDGDQDLAVTFVPANATNKNYTYVVTQDTDPVISVEKNGTTLTIHGIKEGTATITITSEEGSIQKSCTVTVVDAGNQFANDIEPDKLTINKSGTGNLSVSGNGIASVTWSSSSESIATVAAGDDTTTATVTGVGYGTVTITATISFIGGSSDTKTATVTVMPDEVWVYGDIVTDGWTVTGTYDGAVTAGVALTASNDVYSGEVYLPAGKDFRIGHDGYEYKGFDWSYVSTVATEKVNAVKGSRDGKNSVDNIQVNLAGTYNIVVDFTGSKPVVKITVVSIDITSVSVVADQSTLTSEGDITEAVITLTINPESATYTEDDIEWSLSANADSLVTNLASDKNMKMTITVKGGLTSGGIVEVSVSVKGKSASVNITIVEKGKATVPVSEINFEQSSYVLNINDNGTFNGEGIVVKANVNDDATNQGVVYSAADASITINSATGEVTGSKIGTYTITATAAGDESKTTTCTVTFYSDMFYLVGDASNWTATDSNTTVGTAFENYTFKATDDTYKTFKLDVAISSANSKFQIMYIGAGTDWGNAITGANATVSGLTASSNNIVTGAAGLYSITLDISGTKPTVSATSTTIPTYKASLMKDGEGDAVITSDNSTVSNNRYAMTLQTTYELDAVYTIKVGDNTLAINSISGNVVTDESNGSTTYFTLAENKLTCVTAGIYRLTVIYNPTDSSCTVIVEKIAAGWVQDNSGTYGILASYDDNWGSGSWTSNVALESVVYYNSEEGAYEVYFSFTVPANSNFCFGLSVSGEWKDINGQVTLENNSSHFGGNATGNYWTKNSGGLTYFKLEFTVAGGTVTVKTLTASDTDTLNTRG